MKGPEVSVVMGVFNGGPTLGRTIESILTQEGVDLEFIIVDDGSTDGTAELLDDYASRDPRVRVIHQANAGLTSALIRGCSEARGEFIARQDAGGDVSLPGRLEGQAALLRRNPGCVLHSGATRFLGPEGEQLFDSLVTQSELERGLSTLTVPGVRGPSHHGACMFRRAAYERVGGYRLAFTVAQDIDLWLRLYESGSVMATEDIVYETYWTAGGLSSQWGKEQLFYARIAVDCAKARRAGAVEPSLPEPMALQDRSTATGRKQRIAASHYFVGCCLSARDPQAARGYFRKAIGQRPWFPAAWWGYLRTGWSAAR